MEELILETHSSAVSYPFWPVTSPSFQPRKLTHNQRLSLLEESLGGCGGHAGATGPGVSASGIVVNYSKQMLYKVKKHHEMHEKGAEKGAKINQGRIIFFVQNYIYYYIIPQLEHQSGPIHNMERMRLANPCKGSAFNSGLLWRMRSWFSKPGHRLSCARPIRVLVSAGTGGRAYRNGFRGFMAEIRESPPFGGVL